MSIFVSPMNSTVDRNTNIIFSVMIECQLHFSKSHTRQYYCNHRRKYFFTVEDRALIEYLLSPISYSSYTVATTLTSSVRIGTVLGVGLYYKRYAFTKQMA